MSSEQFIAPRENGVSQYVQRKSPYVSSVTDIVKPSVQQPNVLEHFVHRNPQETPQVIDPLGDLQEEAQKGSSLRVERFESPASLPPHIRETANRLGISPDIIVGREVTDAGEVGWLIEVEEATTDGHNYRLEATMKVEEKFKDGFGDEWPGRVWIFPKKLQDGDEEIKIPHMIGQMGYEVLIQTNSRQDQPINIGMDSICLTAMHHGGHLSSHEVHGYGCDCTGQLDARKEFIFDNGGLEFISLADDGRGNGLEIHSSQIHAQNNALKLGQKVPGSYDPAKSMGKPADSRSAFSFMYPLLAKGVFKVGEEIVIATNNGEKVGPFKSFGINAIKRAVKDVKNSGYYERGGNWQDKTQEGGHSEVTDQHVLTTQRIRRTHHDGLRVTDTRPEDIDPLHNQEARAKAIQRIKDAQANGATHVMVLDRDEVLTWTAKRHIQVLLAALSAIGHTENLPTEADVLAMGGTDKAFPLEQYPEYQHLISATRNSARFNTNLPLVQDNIPDILQQAANEGFISAVSITAAPVPIADTIEQGIDQQIRQQVPVIGKPKHVSLDRTAQWKYAEMQRIAEEVPEITLVLLDDSLSTAKYFAEKSAAPDAPSIQCITLTGTLTPAEKVPAGQLATDWDHLIPTLRSLVTQTNQI